MTKPLRLTPIQEVAGNPDLDNFAEWFDQRFTAFEDNLIAMIRTELRAQARCMTFAMVGTVVACWFILLTAFSQLS